jgi:hypothetical protein
MSVIPLKADIHKRGLHGRLVPVADLVVSASPTWKRPTALCLLRKGLLAIEHEQEQVIGNFEPSRED